MPAPHAIALCEDTAVNGAPFYIMSFVEGSCPIDARPCQALRRGQRSRASASELIDTLADAARGRSGDRSDSPTSASRRVHRPAGAPLHRPDRAAPRPATCRSWRSWRAAWRRSIPPESDATIVHGDYRLDNCDPERRRPHRRRARLGDGDARRPARGRRDPRCMYWARRAARCARRGQAHRQQLRHALPGFPTRSEAIARYAEKSGRDLDNLDFYVVLAHFKLAVIVEGIRALLEGGTVGEGFEGMAAQATGARAVGAQRGGPLQRTGAERLAAYCARRRNASPGGPSSRRRRIASAHSSALSTDVSTSRS